MMVPTASDFFGAMAREYDSLIRRAVPRYGEMQERLLAYLPVRAGRVLELGCGTGNFSAMLARRCPAAALTFVDASHEMIEATRGRLGLERAECRVARFEDLDFAAGSFDLVTSCISLHHVVDKGALYARIAAWLAPGGVLCFADQMAGATPELHKVNWEAWLAFCREPGHCSIEEVRQLVEHAEAHDHYTPVAEHLRLLAASGFDAGSIDCVWKNWMWGIVRAVRP